MLLNNISSYYLHPYGSSPPANDGLETSTTAISVQRDRGSRLSTYLAGERGIHFSGSHSLTTLKRRNQYPKLRGETQTPDISLAKGKTLPHETLMEESCVLL